MRLVSRYWIATSANVDSSRQYSHSIKQLNGSVKEPNISIYFFFSAHHSMGSISDVLFTGGRGVSDFSVLKYY